VRELKNAIERAFAYTRGPAITREDLPEAVIQGAHREDGYCFRAWKQKTLERLEREFLAKTLAAHAGNVSRAAKALRINRSTLQRLMRSHSLATASRLPNMGALLQARAD
jgi:transcriptional regulator of acetoin/glycerol metabolism